MVPSESARVSSSVAGGRSTVRAAVLFVHLECITAEVTMQGNLLKRWIRDFQNVLDPLLD